MEGPPERNYCVLWNKTNIIKINECGGWPCQGLILYFKRYNSFGKKEKEQNKRMTMTNSRSNSTSSCEEIVVIDEAQFNKQPLPISSSPQSSPATNVDVVRKRPSRRISLVFIMIGIGTGILLLIVGFFFFVVAPYDHQSSSSPLRTNNDQDINNGMNMINEDDDADHSNDDNNSEKFSLQIKQNWCQGMKDRLIFPSWGDDRDGMKGNKRCTEEGELVIDVIYHGWEAYDKVYNESTTLPIVSYDDGVSQMDAQIFSFDPSNYEGFYKEEQYNSIVKFDPKTGLPISVQDGYTYEGNATLMVAQEGRPIWCDVANWNNDHDHYCDNTTTLHTALENGGYGSNQTCAIYYMIQEIKNGCVSSIQEVIDFYCPCA